MEVIVFKNHSFDAHLHCKPEILSLIFIKRLTAPTKVPMRVLHFVASVALATLVLGGTPAEWKQRTIYQVNAPGLHAFWAVSRAVFHRF